MPEKVIWTALLVGASASGFLFVDNRNALLGPGAWSLPLETSLDAHIPFWPPFVYAYFLYYPWTLLPIFVLRTREAFFRALGAFALMQLLAGTFFVLWPSHMLRPEVYGAGLAADLVRFTYRVDKGWNVCPSLHVGHSVMVALLYYKYGRKYLPVVALGTLLISMSTVFVKQHYIVDVPAGILLAALCYRAAGMEFRTAHASPETEDAGHDSSAF